MVELLIVGAVLVSLAALGGFTYQSYLKSVKSTLSEQQFTSINEQIKDIHGLIVRGADAGLRSPSTGYPITELSTCDDFLAALKAHLAELRNPYDGSPALTFSSAFDWEHKRGKIRITCFKLNNIGEYNGGSCKMNKAGVRITQYHYNCGGFCTDFKCQYPGSDCGGVTDPGWVHGGQTDIYLGGFEARYVELPGGGYVPAPWGGYYPDFDWAREECGNGYNTKVIQKEPDY